MDQSNLLTLTSNLLPRPSKHILFNFLKQGPKGPKEISSLKTLEIQPPPLKKTR